MNVAGKLSGTVKASRCADNQQILWLKDIASNARPRKKFLLALKKR
jgi:hypothetical protein